MQFGAFTPLYRVHGAQDKQRQPWLYGPTAERAAKEAIELRSKLIQLRRHYIPASISIEKLCDLMSDSLSSFAVLFRAVLVLFGCCSPGEPRHPAPG